MSLITQQYDTVIQHYLTKYMAKHPGQPAPSYFMKDNEVIDFATVYMAQQDVTVSQEQFSFDEFNRLLGDLDSLARQRDNEEVAAMVAEGVPAILAAARWAKVKGTQEYIGQRATGRQLVATWLRPIHIGNTLLTSATTSGTGLYGGTGGAVYSWQPSTDWTAGTAKTWYPSQVMYESCAIVVLGFLETEEIPAVDGYRFTLNGSNTPVLPLKFNLQRRQAQRDPVVAKLLEPVILGPQVTVAADLYPNKSKTSQPEPLAILVTMASSLTA